MNQAATSLEQALPWVKVVDRDLIDLPKAARRIYPHVLRWFQQHETITATDREFCRLCNIGRRCVQKGLLQLQKAGIISRARKCGRRIITFLRNLASKKKVQSKRGSTGGHKTANQILTELRAVNWSAMLGNNGKALLYPIPGSNAAPLPAELRTLAEAHLPEIAAVILARRPRRE